MMVNLSYYRFIFKCPQMRLFCSSSLYRKFKRRFTSKHRRTSPELHKLKNNFWIDCRWKQGLDDQETKVRHTTIYGLTLNPTFIVYFFSNTMRSISVIHCPQSDCSVWRRNLIWVVARHARTEREKTEKRLHITARCQKAFGKHFDIHRWEYVNPVFISPFSDDARLNYLISVHMASCKNRLSKAFLFTQWMTTA